MIKLSIKGKILGGFALLIVLLGIVGMYSASLSSDIKIDVQNLKDEAVRGALESMRMKLAVVQVQQWLTDSSATGWEDGFEEAEKWSKVFTSNLNNLKNIFEDDKKIISQLKSLEDSFSDYNKMGISMARAYVDQGREDGNLKMKEFDSFAEDINKKVDDFEEASLEKLDNTLTSVYRLANNSSQLNAYMTFVSIILGIAVAFFISSLIVNPINKIVIMLKDIATGEGDLTKRITVNQRDEVGELAKWFNTFVDKIESLVIQISNTGINLGSAAEEMAASIEESSSTSAEIAKSAELQSSSVMESNQSISEMDRAIKGVAANSNEAQNIAKKADFHAAKGGEAVTHTISAMKEIEESSKKIEVIVGVITDIANQTNLLALNAAIEAAKAGEQGKGFAVVAEEVRKLAERSGESTKEIKILIDESTERVAKGTKVANEAGTALAKIIEGVQTTTDLVSKISSGAEEQSIEADQVTKALDELSNISEQNASGAEELSATTTELAKASDELSTMADELNQIVSQFKVGKNKQNRPGSSDQYTKHISGISPGRNSNTGLVLKQ